MNAMIDHEELERVKKLEDVEWLRTNKVNIDIHIDPFPLVYSYRINVWYGFLPKKMQTFKSKTSLHDCKLQAMDFLEGRSK